MLYVLPATPTITLVGPDNTAWWAALGADPAGRSALVIGDPADPAAALVIAAALPDFDAYLPLFHTAVRRTVDAGSGRHVTGPRPLAIPDGTTEPAAAAAATLVTLPHTGIRVPDATLQVTAYQELPTPAGVAYTATLRWGPPGSAPSTTRAAVVPPPSGRLPDPPSIAESWPSSWPPAAAPTANR